MFFQRVDILYTYIQYIKSFGRLREIFKKILYLIILLLYRIKTDFVPWLQYLWCKCAIIILQMYVYVTKKYHIKYAERCVRFSSPFSDSIFFSEMLIRISPFFLFLWNYYCQKRIDHSVLRVFHLVVTSKRNLSTVSTATSSLVSIGQTAAGSVLFAAANARPTRGWQCNQRLSLYRFRVFAIFPPFRLSVDARLLKVSNSQDHFQTTLYAPLAK